ncbi:hypothetical protein J5N97_021139 [Dioscorea zingiberensis]|uniref:Non-haem dioxygenase N-terminal domain-containing protein n=1 Tax=Dioscorea zingiberensis TaxID=325984 RepID=A0A9D5CJC1_9LILI|nr:hypothetical protein J5N97_021139 [Dioscorea zingiberensis]
MCASTTGVVRVQSRKKSRDVSSPTDGFSCTRKSYLAVLLDLSPGFGFVQTFYSQDTSDLHERVDFVACLGGDGVILHASNLFRGAVPPVVSLLTLDLFGFLTSHTVHPNVPCVLFTPICPHSLSFRPVILPDSAQLELKIPEDARSNAWVSFDGKRRQQLLRGDSVRISMSQHPLPTVNKSDQTGDWFLSLIRCLNWNERLDQKAFTMVVPVIDFSKLDGEERDKTLTQIANGCEEWGFFQLVNHGIPLELLERVKKVCSECFKVEREEMFKDSSPVQLLNKLVDHGEHGTKLEDVDWEDVFILQDDNQWPSNPPHFKETMKEYRAELKKLAEKIMEVMDENLGLEKGYIKRAFSGGVDEDGVELHHPFFGTKAFHPFLVLFVYTSNEISLELNGRVLAQQ